MLTLTTAYGDKTILLLSSTAYWFIIVISIYLGYFHAVYREIKKGQQERDRNSTAFFPISFYVNFVLASVGLNIWLTIVAMFFKNVL